MKLEIELGGALRTLALILAMAVIVIAFGFWQHNLYLNRADEHVELALWAAAVLGLALAVTVAAYGGGMRTAYRTLKGWRVVGPVIAVIALAVMSIALAQGDKANRTDSAGSVSMNTHLSGVGAIFAACVAIVTIVGFVLTISRLEDIHGRILDYPHLIERCSELAKRELERVSNNKQGRFWILANTAGFGNVSARDEYGAFLGHLKGILPHGSVHVKLACLDWEPIGGAENAHDAFYKKYFGIDKRIDERIRESRELIRLVKSGTSEFPEQKELWALKPSFDEAPFHLVLSSERAILFTALSYPDASQAIPGAASASTARKRRVEVIGFETGDRAILTELERGLEARLAAVAVKR